MIETGAGGRFRGHGWEGAPREDDRGVDASVVGVSPVKIWSWERTSLQRAQHGQRPGKRGRGLTF